MKIIFLLISICLIGLVLYLGYMLDKKEEQAKRKRKYDIDSLNVKNTSASKMSKTPKKEYGIQNIKKNIQEKLDDAKGKIEEKKTLKAEQIIKQLNMKRVKEHKIQEDIDDEESSWESLDEEFLIERKLNDFKNEGVENIIIPTEKSVKDETIPINTLKQPSKEKNSQNTLMINTIGEKDLEMIQKKMLDSFVENDLDSEEDELLLDIEREIEQANIKRFTRVKKENVTKKRATQKEKEAKKDDISKKTTKKNETKDSKSKEKSSNVKRFTRVKKDKKGKAKKKSK